MAAREQLRVGNHAPEGAHVFNLHGDSVAVADIVAAIEEVAPNARGRITFDGPPIPIPPALAGDAIHAAVEDYLAIGAFLDAGLSKQVEHDLDALECVTGRRLTDRERETARIVQHQANRYTYLGSGMTHERFLETIEALSPSARRRIEKAAPAFC